MITIREANSDDNLALLKLTAITPMNTQLVLKIDRMPDFFNLINERGSGKVFVALEENKIVGAASISTYNKFWNYSSHRISYLADFKIDPEYQGRIVLWLLVKALKDFALKNNCNIIYTIAAVGNSQVENLLKLRKSLPEFTPVFDLNVYQFMPKLRKPQTQPGLGIICIDKNRFEELNLARYFNDFYKDYNLAPIVTNEYLTNSRVIIALNGKEVLAAVSIRDMSKYKQNVVLKIPPSLKLLLLLLRLVRKLLPSYSLPRIGEALKILYVNLYAFTPGNEKALKVLFKWARWEVYRQDYHFLSFGFDSNDYRLFTLLKYMPKVCFKSRAYCSAVLGANESSLKIPESSLYYQDISKI